MKQLYLSMDIADLECDDLARELDDRKSELWNIIEDQAGHAAMLGQPGISGTSIEASIRDAGKEREAVADRIVAIEGEMRRKRCP